MIIFSPPSGVSHTGWLRSFPEIVATGLASLDESSRLAAHQQ